MLFFNVHFIQHTILTMGVECMAKRDGKLKKSSEEKKKIRKAKTLLSVRRRNTHKNVFG